MAKVGKNRNRGYVLRLLKIKIYKMKKDYNVLRYVEQGLQPCVWKA
jgi:hypothetical protein